MNASARMIAVCFFGSALFGLVGCGTVPADDLPPVAKMTRPVISVDELSGNWVVYAIGRLPLTGEQLPQLAFAADQRVGGMAGCNRFLGEYQLDADGVLQFGEIMVTRRLCPEPVMSQESLLLNRLRAVNFGRLAPGGDLLLYYDVDRLPIRLHREEA